METSLAKCVAFFERCVALLPNFRENPPRYVLKFYWIFSEITHSIPVGKCVVFQDWIDFWITAAWFWKECHLIGTLIETLFFTFERFLFAKCAALLEESVARVYCRFHWWCKHLFKTMCCLFSSKYCTTFSNMSFKGVQLFFGHVVLFRKGCYVTFKRSSKCAISYLCRILLKTMQSKL